MGSVLHLAVCNLPDIEHDVAQLAPFVAHPHTCHLEELKGVLKYIKGTNSFGLFYIKRVSRYTLHTFADSSWADEIITNISSTGTLTYADNYLAEYIAADTATRTVVRLRSLMNSLGELQEGETVVNKDNLACVRLSRV